MASTAGTLKASPTATRSKRMSNAADFRINGLLMDERGEIFDYVEGREDLRNRIIQTIGIRSNASTRMRCVDDACLLFSGETRLRNRQKTGRGDPGSYKERLKDVAMERIQVELIKMPKGKYA